MRRIDGGRASPANPPFVVARDLAGEPFQCPCREPKGRLGHRAVHAAASGSPQTADTTIPQGVPCTRLANLILAPKEEAKRIAAYIARWGIWLAAHLVESKAWAMYRDRLKRFASLIGDREPVVLQRQLPGMGSAKRYIITIADDDRRSLDKLCQKLTAAEIACDVMRNGFGPG